VRETSPLAVTVRKRGRRLLWDAPGCSSLWRLYACSGKRLAPVCGGSSLKRKRIRSTNKLTVKMNEVELDISQIKSELFLTLLERESVASAALRHRSVDREISRIIREVRLLASGEGVADRAEGAIKVVTATLAKIREEYLHAFERSVNARSAFLAIARQVPDLARIEQLVRVLISEAEEMPEVSSRKATANAIKLVVARKVREGVERVCPTGLGAGRDATELNPDEMALRINVMLKMSDYVLEDYVESSP
jgi:hypothetical protein